MTHPRKGISKRTRFEIFKRDLFVCRYCGRRPPDVLLEVDHVIPVAGGGSDDPDNLATACVACNAGKSSVSLGYVVPPIDELTRLAAVQEVLERAVNARKSLEAAKVQAEADDEAVALLCDWWEEAFGSLDHVEIPSLRGFVRRLPLDDIRDAIDITERRQGSGRSYWKTFRYFCGVCWSKAREAESGESHGA